MVWKHGFCDGKTEGRILEMEKKRLITRSDFDGLVCAMLLRELDMIDEIKFVHPKDVQDGKVDINENDITTNLPFDPRVGLAFDHHESELVRNNMEAYGHKFICLREKSAARVVYNYYGVFPIEKEYVVAGLFKNIESNSTTNSIIMSMNDFRSIFHDKPGMVLLRSSNPDATADAMNTYGVGSYGSVRTIDQVMQEERNQNNTTLNIFAAIIAIAVSMTCIGVISNQLIGFEGRKKECAVMLSTAMSRKTLTGVLFREMIITSVTSTLLGTCIGSIMVYVIKSALDSSDSLYIPINYNFGLIALMWVAMTLLFVLTVLFPVRNLKKMKISEQIKYE